MTAAGIEGCNDDVLGDDLERNQGNPDKGDTVAPNRVEQREGGVLPFTGASILAYVVIALQLIGAGALMSRARKKK